MNADESAHVDLRRVKSATEVIGDALRCYGRYPALFAALTLAVVVPYGVIVLLIDRAGLLGVSRHGATAAIIVVLLNLLLVGPLISALHVHAVAEIGEGREPNLRQVFARGVRVLPVVAAAEIVAGIATGIGFLALIVPGLILLARWAVVAQAAAIERVDWSSALRRSAELTRGSYLHVLGVLISVGLIDSVIENVGTAVAGSGANPLQVVVGIAVETVTLSFAALTGAMLYYDLLARRSSAAPSAV
jgi:hypothetical protein